MPSCKWFTYLASSFRRRSGGLFYVQYPQTHNPPKVQLGIVVIVRKGMIANMGEFGDRSMMKHDEFKPAGEVVADERARLSFGKAGVRRDDRFAVAVSDNGEILLTPLVSIPKRELFVWENELVREQLSAGLRESAKGEVEDLGDFSKYADDNED